MLTLNQENDQRTLRAPWMTTKHRYTPDNKDKDKNKNKITSLSPLYSQLIQKLRSLHCDSCLVTELLDQGTTGALAVYGLPEGLLKNDSGRIKVTPDLDDEWVHHHHPVPVRGGCGDDGAGASDEQRQQHEKMIKNDFNDAEFQVLNNWNYYDVSSEDDDRNRDKMDGTQPFVTVLNQTGVGCAYDDDSIAGSIGDTSILRPDSDFSNSNVNTTNGELEKCTTTPTTPITTPFFQEFSPSLLPPPTPRPRPRELSNTDFFEDHSSSLSLLPPSPPPTSQHTMVLFSSDWEMKKTQYYSLTMDDDDDEGLYKQQQSPDHVVSVLFEPTSSLPFSHFIPSLKDEEIGRLTYPVDEDSLDDDLSKHCDMLGLAEEPRPRTAHGRQEVNLSSDCLDEPPPAPRLGVLSDDFGDEEDESEFETNHDSDTVYLFDPFGSQQNSSSSNSSWCSNPTDSESAHNSTMKHSPPPLEENPSCSQSYPSPPPSPNPLFPPGLPFKPSPPPPPSKKTKSPSLTPTTTQSLLYALSEKSQWKLSVMRYQRSLSTRGMRHPGFPPSPLGPNWEIYHARDV